MLDEDISGDMSQSGDLEFCITVELATVGPLKDDDWKTILSSLGHGLFSGTMLNFRGVVILKPGHLDVPGS